MLSTNFCSKKFTKARTSNVACTQKSEKPEESTDLNSRKNVYWEENGEDI